MRAPVWGDRSFEPVRDPAFGEIVRCHLDQHLVAGEYADAVLAHATGGVGDDLVLVLELDAKSGVRQQFRDDTGKFQQLFLRHSQPEFVDLKAMRANGAGKIWRGT